MPATRLVEEPAQNDRGFADFLSGPDIVDPEQNHPLSPRAQPRYPELSESDRVKSHQPQAHGFDRRFTIFDRYPLYPDTSFDLGPRSDLRDEEVPDDVKELMMRKKEPTVFKKNLGRREWRPKKAKSPEAADNGDDAVMDDWIDFSKTA